jgi:hypothetical protein
MPIYNFKSKFADDVESGKKRQTIRKKRKRPTKVGETLYLYTGLRTKKARKLKETVCMAIYDIEIYWNKVIVDGKEYKAYFILHRLALNDGFKDFKEMALFFHITHHGLPFKNGEIIKW